MKSISINDLIAVFSLLITISSTLAAVAFWYANSEKRKYGLERDFAHLKRSYKQIDQSLTFILKEFDRRFDIAERDILEIKSIINNNLKKDS